VPLTECLAAAGLTLKVEEEAAQITKNPGSNESQARLFSALRGL
jgi:hypothetical protein